MLLLQGDVLHQVVGPLYARETDGVGAILEHVNDALREIAFLTVVGTHGIVEGGIFVRAGLLDHLGRCQCRERQVKGYFSLTFLSALGGDQHYTIRTTNTEYGRSRSILQYGNALDFVGVDIPHLAFHTIHLNQG